MIAEGLVIASLATSVDPLVEARRGRVRYYRRVAQRVATPEPPSQVVIVPIRCYTPECPSFEDMWSYLPRQWQVIITPRRR